jgi:hypothetical protein
VRKADVEAKARQMAEAAFENRPNMDEIALGHYLIVDESQSAIPWRGHTTYQQAYKDTYRRLQRER